MAKCTISKTRMPEKDAEVLRSKFTFLEQNIDASHLTAFLFQQSIIDEDDMNSIDKIAVRKARNKELLQILLSRGNDAWSTFITALRTNGYKEVTNSLFLPKKDSVAYATKPSSRVSTKSGHEEDKEENMVTTLLIKVNKLETELKSVNDENESLKCELLLKDQTIAGNVETIQKLTQEIGQLKYDIAQLQTDGGDKAERIQALDKKVTVLQSDFNTKLKRMEVQLEKLNSKVCVLS